MTGYLRRLADRTGLGRSARRDAAGSVSPLEVVEAVTVAAPPPPARPALDRAPAAREFGRPQDVHVVAPEVGQARAVRAAAPEAAQRQSARTIASQPPSQPLLPVVPRGARERAAPIASIAPTAPANSIPASTPIEPRPRNDVPPVQTTTGTVPARPMQVPTPDRGHKDTLPAAPPPPAAARAANVTMDRLPPPHAVAPTIAQEPAIRELSERILRQVEPARARPEPPGPFRPPAMAPRRQEPQPTVRIGSIRLDVRAPEPAPAQPASPARPDPPPRPVPLRRFHVRTW